MKVLLRVLVMVLLLLALLVGIVVTSGLILLVPWIVIIGGSFYDLIWGGMDSEINKLEEWQ